MSSLLSVLLNPLISLSPSWADDGEDGRGFDVVYPLTTCVALGIWLVVRRYRKAQYAAVSFEYEPHKAAEPTYQSIVIDNAHLNSHLENEALCPPVSVEGARYITCFDPATGIHLATLKADSEEEITNKIALAAEAQKTWRQTNFGRRRRVLRSLNKWLVENQEVCARTACRDTGKTRTSSRSCSPPIT